MTAARALAARALRPQQIAAYVERYLHHYPILLGTGGLRGHFYVGAGEGGQVAVKGGEFGGHVLLHRPGDFDVAPLDVEFHFRTSR